MQSAAEAGPGYRNKRATHKDEHRTDVLQEHQSQVRQQRFVIPTFVEVLDNTPERPKACDKDG